MKCVCVCPLGGDRPGEAAGAAGGGEPASEAGAEVMQELRASQPRRCCRELQPLPSQPGTHTHTHTARYTHTHTHSQVHTHTHTHPHIKSVRGCRMPRPCGGRCLAGRTRPGRGSTGWLSWSESCWRKPPGWRASACSWTSPPDSWTMDGGSWRRPGGGRGRQSRNSPSDCRSVRTSSPGRLQRPPESR